MLEHPLVGLWTVKKPSRLGNLGKLDEIRIERDLDSDRFLITSANADLRLPDLIYDAEEDLLFGRCEGRVGGIEGSFQVAVVPVGPPSAQRLKGVVFFGPGRHREDNAVGTWTADKKPGDPPPRS